MTGHGRTTKNIDIPENLPSKQRVNILLVVFRDVSEQRGAAKASRKNQELLQLIHKIAKIGHWEWNSITDENKWSPEIEALCGLPPGGYVEFAGKPAVGLGTGWALTQARRHGPNIRYSVL